MKRDTPYTCNMRNKKTVFITIAFVSVSGLFDYPKHLPIPRVGEIVIFNDKLGMVSQVKHITSGDVTEIKICCINY